MAYFIFGIALVFLVHFGFRAFIRANPAILAGLAKSGGGLLSLLLAAVLLMRGRVNLALTFGGIAMWLFGGRQIGSGFGGIGGTRPTGTDESTSGLSKVRSATLEMELDHASGAMHGTVVVGPLSGRRLDDLDRGECLTLHGQCASIDPEGARLLEAYLDRRFPDWRSQRAEDATRRGTATAMTMEEAFDVLGLPLGADQEQITRAHRELMKRLHPDHGGSTYLAARVNAAKDLLLRRQ
jgi:hypothetical protein